MSRIIARTRRASRQSLAIHIPFSSHIPHRIVRSQKVLLVLHANPIHIKSGVRAEPFHQFSGVLLQVPNGVDLQFGFVEGQRVEARLRIEIELRHVLDHLLLAKGKIFQSLFFGVRISRSR